MLSDASKILITPHIQKAMLACKAAVELNSIGEPHLLRVLSPLAEGSDRCVADIALSFGYELEAIIPFTQKDYEIDFEWPVNSGITGAKCLDEFRSLLSKAVQPPFYVPVICGFTKHVSGTGGRIPRA